MLLISSAVTAVGGVAALNSGAYRKVGNIKRIRLILVAVTVPAGTYTTVANITNSSLYPHLELSKYIVFTSSGVVGEIKIKTTGEIQLNPSSALSSATILIVESYI